MKSIATNFIVESISYRNVALLATWCDPYRKVRTTILGLRFAFGFGRTLVYFEFIINGDGIDSSKKNITGPVRFRFFQTVSVPEPVPADSIGTGFRIICKI